MKNIIPDFKRFETSMIKLKQIFISDIPNFNLLESAKFGHFALKLSIR